MQEPIIRSKDLKVIYNLGKQNEVRALDGIDVEIYPREYIVFFGPSGCGKSTLLYAILGVLPPTFGKVTIKGKDPYSFDSQELVNFQQSTVGIVYQAFYLIPSLTVLDNVALPQIFAEVDPEQRKNRAMALLDRFGIKEQAEKIPTALSGGQRQRVAISRALVNNPEILLADEPVGNLDEASAKRVMETLEEINERDRKTVILVSHDPRYLSYAHRVYYLRDGKLEREVANPEKEQIKKAEKAKNLITELESLARIYPYRSPDELRVKSVVNYLTRDITFEQLERLEKLTGLVIKGKLSEEQFCDSLSRSYARGGVGLHPSTSDKMARRIKKIVKESRDIRRYRRELEGKSVLSRREELVERMKDYLLDVYGGEVNEEQTDRLKRAISDRISGDITKEEFQERLDLSFDDGGMGLKKKSAKNITVYFEKLLVQGI